MVKILAYTQESMLHGSRHLLQCAICGENDRNKLIIEDLGISIGVCGEEYSFCEKCWNSKKLGEKILKLLEYPGGLKMKDDCLDLKEIYNE